MARDSRYPCSVSLQVAGGGVGDREVVQCLGFALRIASLSGELERFTRQRDLGGRLPASEGYRALPSPRVPPQPPDDRRPEGPSCADTKSSSARLRSPHLVCQLAEIEIDAMRHWLVETPPRQSAEPGRGAPLPHRGGHAVEGPALRGAAWRPARPDHPDSADRAQCRVSQPRGRPPAGPNSRERPKPRRARAPMRRSPAATNASSSACKEVSPMSREPGER